MLLMLEYAMVNNIDQNLMQVQDVSSQLLPSQLDVYQVANIFQRITFGWVFPLIKQGRIHLLQQTDLFTIREQDSAKVSYQKYFNQFIHNNYLKLKIRITLFRAFKEKIILTYIIYALISFVALIQPILTQKAQTFFVYENQQDKPTLNAVLTFALVQLAYLTVLSIMRAFLTFEQKLLSVKIQGSTQTHMISKSIQFPLLRSNIYNSGELINMLQVDVTQASNYYTNTFAVYLVPVQLIFSGIIFYYTMQGDAIYGGAGAIVQALVGILFGYVYGLIQNKFMKAKDLRMACVDEALVQVKQIKLNCLEDYFEQRITKYRNDELKYLKYQLWMMTIVRFSQQLFQLLAFELTFLFADSVDFSFYMVLVSNYIGLLDLMQNLPIQLKNYYTSLNSLERLNDFFNQEDLIQEYATDGSNYALSIENGKFNWNTIENIDDNKFQIELSLKIQKHKFIAIVGNAASGKSSILKSIIGEMNKIGSNYIINGSFSICSQEPWIISGNIKNNITYMQEFSQDRYNKVIKVCGLEHDLQCLHDQVISEKGDNLSGGQRKRINLARTVYQEVDIYLLDDPLSALDIMIYQQCFKEFLRDKTRILFANNFANLQGVDYIYVIEDGKIKSEGTYQEIMKIDKDKEYNIDYKFEEKHYTQEIVQYQNNNELTNEDQQVGDISSSVKKQIFKYQGSWMGVVIILFFVILGFAFAVVGNLKMADAELQSLILVRSTDQFKDVALVYYPMMMLAMAIYLCSIMLFILLRGVKTSTTIHHSVIKSLINASFTKFYNRILLGRLMNRLSKDIYNIDIQFPSELYTLIMAFFDTFTAILTAIIFLNIAASPFLIVYVILIILCTRVYYRCLTEVTRIESVSKSPIFNYFQQIIRGITFVRSSLPKQDIIANQTINIDIDLSNQLCLYGLQSWYQLYTSLITNIFQVLLFIICVIQQLKQFLFPSDTQNITYAILTNMSSLSLQIMLLTLTQGNVLMYSVSFERCLYLANEIETDIQNTKRELIPNKALAIEMRQSTFKYRLDLGNVLSNLSFKVFQGQKIGIVGRTGSGKSSLIMALTNMLEQVNGDILINESSTKHIQNIRQYYSIIPQDPLIFMGTLKENLDPLNEYSDPKVNQIIQLCELKTEFIEIAGKNLSLGEKQLLSIGRCLLKNRPIVLIDEATACIDSQTENKIKEIFQNQFKNQTVLTIAHKVSTIMNSDKIMVINNGQISEFDDPKVLLTNPDSEFKQIVDMINKSEQL